MPELIILKVEGFVLTHGLCGFSLWCFTWREHIVKKFSCIMASGKQVGEGRWEEICQGHISNDQTHLR